MTIYTPVKSGEKTNISATEWNAVRKTIFYPENKENVQKHQTGFVMRPVKVRNGQPELVPAFGVLRIDSGLEFRQTDDLYEQATEGIGRGIEVDGIAPMGDENEIIGILQRPAEEAWIIPCVTIGATLAWVYVNSVEHRYAKAIPDNVQMLESADSGSVRLMYPATSEGLQLLPVLLGFPDKSEPAINAKELFPAIVYTKQKGKYETETYIICPGGKGKDKSTKTVHVLHVEGKKVSTSMFGTLPVAMNNFDAVIADNSYGSKVLVCSTGDIDEGSKYPVQRYDFLSEEWSKSDTNQSLAGCPAYLKDGKIIVAGGQSAYFVSNPVKTAGSSVTQFYGHNVSPFWTIDPASGTLETRIPRRLITSGTSEQPESAVVNQQKRWLKQNFSGIHFERNENGKPVEFIAVGGTELLGYQSKAVVSYAMNSTGSVLDCEHADVHIGGENEIFPDTPIAFGECDAVRITRRRSGEMMVDCNLLACFGGRFRIDEDAYIKTENGDWAKDENGNEIIQYRAGEFAPNKKVWTLDLDKKEQGWRNDLLPELPTPRWNAGLSDVVTTTELVKDENGKPETDENGNPTNRTQEISRVFLIGGRIDNRTAEKVTRENGTFYYKLVTQKGLTANIEALNLTTGKWETDFPNL
ncbi:MAG: hypothetical protein LBK82_17195 [Planctomycetaceae bacterium]|jgi:hypothetical protein|nr:hypothetical protein [Planctomycetaceae bacterium]